MSKNIPSILRNARQRKGLTCEQVAQSVSLTKGWISRIELEGTNSIKTAQKLKNLFPDLSIEQICKAEKVND